MEVKDCDGSERGMVGRHWRLSGQYWRALYDVRIGDRVGAARDVDGDDVDGVALQRNRMGLHAITVESRYGEAKRWG